MNAPSVRNRTRPLVALVAVLAAIAAAVIYAAAQHRLRQDALATLASCEESSRKVTDENAALRDEADRRGADAVRERNNAWRVLNGEEVEPTNGALIGGMLGVLVGKDIPDEVRNAALQDYQQRVLLYLTPEETALAAKAITPAGTEQDTARALRAVARASVEVERFTLSILDDERRLRRYIDGDLPIPLETLPDGSTP